MTKVCRLCGGTGFISKEGRILPCDCTTTKALQLPPRYVKKDFSNFHAYNPSLEHAKLSAIDYALNFPDYRKEGTGLFLWGGPGAGKTHLAVATIKEIYKRHGVQSLFLDVSEFLDTILRNEETFRRYSEFPLVVLDGLDPDTFRSWQGDRLISFLNYRYNHMLPTIITSILPPLTGDGNGLNSLATKLNASIAYKLKESSIVLMLKGESPTFGG